MVAGSKVKYVHPVHIASRMVNYGIIKVAFLLEYAYQTIVQVTKWKSKLNKYFLS
jgi:hypothetical protein